MDSLLSWLKSFVVLHEFCGPCDYCSDKLKCIEPAVNSPLNSKPSRVPQHSAGLATGVEMKGSSMSGFVVSGFSGSSLKLADQFDHR